MTRIQHSQERQRGYQLMASDGTAVKDASGDLIFEVVYENSAAPTDPADGSGNHWVKMWDNDLKHTTEVSPHVDTADAGTVADPSSGAV